MNRIRPIKGLGMPFHGLVTDGVLSKPGGDITIVHDADIEGCIAWRHKNPPTLTRTAEQIADDTALGREWRDYVLLNGPNRQINGGPALGGTKWLCCDDGGAVWVLEIVLTRLSNVVTIEVWRRELFGRFTVGFDRTITDELIGSQQFSVPDFSSPVPITGAFLASRMYVSAASIVPNIHGDVVNVHIIHDREDVTPPLTSYWDGARGAFWGVVTFTITGSGDLAAEGVGLTATPSNPRFFPDTGTLLRDDVPADFATLDPTPLGHISGGSQTSCEPDPPPSAGLTCFQECTTTFTHDGTIFVNTGPYSGEDYRWLILDWFADTADQRNSYYNTIDGWYTLSGDGGTTTSAGTATMDTTYQYESVADGLGGFEWSYVGITDETCAVWQYGESNSVTEWEQECIVGIHSVIVTADSDLYSQGNQNLSGPGNCNCVGAFATDGFPSPANTSQRNQSFSEPYTIVADDVILNYLELQAITYVWPGLVKGSVVFRKPPVGDNLKDNPWVNREALYGIGEDGTLTLISSGIYEGTDPAPEAWVWGYDSVAWQPVDKTFVVTTDGSQVKYV